MSRTLHRPEPVRFHAARPVDRSVPPELAAQRLRDGESLMLSDLYESGEPILAALERAMPLAPPDAPFAARQQARRARRAAALRLLVPIRDHQPALQDGRPMKLLSVLYPELSSFILPFVRVQELFGAWLRYKEGVHLAVLGHRLHPFYGTYVPTRTAHLELFGTWLSQHQGARGRAIDVGTGCGVLALMLTRAGYPKVLATDNNPNAIESVERELKRLQPAPPVTPFFGDLLGDGKNPVDLVVFNPPWIRGEIEGLLDTALYYDDEALFTRFFDQCAARLAPDGRVVLLFSNVQDLMQPDETHPIRAELERGRFRLVQKLQRRIKPGADEQGARRRTRERVEVWELARAT